MKKVLVFIICIGIAVMLCSCEEGYNASSQISKQESEIAMKLITREEFIQFIRDNETGVSEEDFKNIDIDEFIKYWKFTSPSEGEDAKLLELGDSLEWYKDILEIRELQKKSDKLSMLMAVEKVSVDSTDEEYEAFIKAYFGALEMEQEISEPSRSGLDTYVIDINDGTYYLYIGKTKDIEKYNIKYDKIREWLEILIPAGQGASWNLSFCYSGDNKFFLSILAKDNNDSKYELYELFTKTTVVQE